MDKHHREIVERAIHEFCKFKNWDIHALNVRTNHIHLVVTANDETPERVMTRLKCWASRRLNENKSIRNNRRWWTRHGSTRYINSKPSLLAAIDYVNNQ
ncbi:MAG: transposase [Planctomycetota bacterium]|nr:MAG: transposase [Planctomycetota bacterium]